MVSRGIVAAVLVAATVSGGSAGAEEKILNVYNWSDYIAEDTIQKFEAETGIKVNYDVFDSNEIVEAKLLTGSTGYDVVVPTANFLERQVKAGVFRKLDPALLPNLKNMDPVISDRVALHDPGNQHAVTYMWGTTGFGYNVKAITDRLGAMPTDTWALFFDPAVVSKLADCGVSLLDAPTDVMATALKYLGLDPNSESPDDLAKAEALMATVRPHIRYFHSSQYIDDLANGETCLAMGYSGDILQAADRAAEAKQGVEVQYVIPKEGAVVWFDMLASRSAAAPAGPRGRQLGHDETVRASGATLAPACRFSRVCRPGLHPVRCRTRVSAGKVAGRPLPRQAGCDGTGAPVSGRRFSSFSEGFPGISQFLSFFCK